jgi:hypothetical protein
MICAIMLQGVHHGSALRCLAHELISSINPQHGSCDSRLLLAFLLVDDCIPVFMLAT